MTRKMTTSRSEPCDHCGKPAQGSVNGLHFCTDRECMDATIAKAVLPAAEIARRMREDEPEPGVP